MSLRLRSCSAYHALLLACSDEAPFHADAARDVHPVPTQAPEARGAEPAPDLDGGATASGSVLDASDVDAGTAAPIRGGSADASRAPLVLPELWSHASPASDPFPDRPLLVRCAAAAVMAETLADEAVLSVDTGGCNYLTATQLTRRHIAPHETVHVRLWHFELSATERAEAHAALRIDDLTVLDERITIPQTGGLISREVSVGRAIPAGAPAYFHLHNHGANSWSLVEVSAGPARDGSVAAARTERE